MPLCTPFCWFSSSQVHVCCHYRLQAATNLHWVIPVSSYHLIFWTLLTNSLHFSIVISMKNWLQKILSLFRFLAHKTIFKSTWNAHSMCCWLLSSSLDHAIVLSLTIVFRLRPNWQWSSLMHCKFILPYYPFANWVSHMLSSYLSHFLPLILPLLGPIILLTFISFWPFLLLFLYFLVCTNHNVLH